MWFRVEAEAEGGDQAGAGGSVGLGAIHTNKVSQQISRNACEPLQCLAYCSHFQNIKMAVSSLILGSVFKL